MHSVYASVETPRVSDIRTCTIKCASICQYLNFKNPIAIDVLEIKFWKRATLI